METTDEEFADEFKSLFESVSEEVEKEEDNNIDSDPESDEPVEEPDGQEPTEEEDDGDDEGEEEDGEVTTPVVEPAADDSKDAVIAGLEAQIAKLTTLVESVVKPSEPEPVKPEPPKVEDLEKLFEGLDFDNVVDTREGFVEFMRNAFQALQTGIVSQVNTQIPDVVGSVVTQQTSLKEMVAEFYESNPELASVKAYVGKIADEISAKDPNLSIKEVLDKAAIQAKEGLGIKDAVEKKVATPDPKPAKPSKPALPGNKSGARKTSAQPSKLQSEIDEILND
jgi:hypothetical protein